MDKLFETIKNIYLEVKKFEDFQKKDFNSSRNFNNFLKPSMDLNYFADFITYLNDSGEEFLGEEGFKEYLNSISNIIGPNQKEIPIPSYNKDLIDYEKIIDKFEEKLKKDQIDDIANRFDLSKKNGIFKPVSHPFENIVNKIKNDLNDLNFTEEEIAENGEMYRLDKEKTIKSLDYANSMIVLKHEAQIDHIIDNISLKIENESRNRVDSFAEKNGINKDVLKDAELNGKTLNFNIPDKNVFNELKPAANYKFKLTDEFKNKIRALDSLVRQKSIMKDVQYGESGNKEYGFIDWFKKTDELKKELLANNVITNDIKYAKAASYNRINKLTGELEAITNEYKEVLDFIKQNFNLNEIAALPGNIYAGRIHPLTEDIIDFYPNLPEFFDNENAAYGVLLNGYSQLKGFIDKNNLTLEEFLEDPVKAYYKGCKAKIKEIDDTLNLPSEGNSLGKRMARVLLQPNNKYNYIYQLRYGLRSLEFLNAASNMSDDTYDNSIAMAINNQMVLELDHSSTILFNGDSTQNEELKKLFALGNQEQDLFKLSSNYNYIEENNINMDQIYNNRIEEMKNNNPVTECNRVMEILKDYFKERKYMAEHRDELIEGNDEFVDNFEPGRIITAAKQYFDDYIYKNDIDINKITDKDEREIVSEFIRNPVRALKIKYREEPDMFITGAGESFESYNNDFGKEWRMLHNADFNNFMQSFNENNQKPNGFNTNKDITTILADNKGGIWENFFKTTSPEYLALKDAIVSATSNTSATRGDFQGVKFYAKKYLEYKLPPGTNENKISETGRRRIEFCRSILNALDSLDDRFKEPKLNQPMNDINAPNITNENQADREANQHIADHNINHSIKVNAPIPDLASPGEKINNFQAEIKEEVEDDMNTEKEIDEEYEEDMNELDITQNL